MLTEIQAGANLRPCILIISPHNSYRIPPYLNAARQLEIDAVVVSQGKYSLVSPVATGIHVDFSNHDEAFTVITSALTNWQVAAVIGTDDQTVSLSSRLSQYFGLLHNAPEASLLTRRKDLARNCLAKCCLSQSGLRIPAYEKHELTSLLKNPVHSIEYPCVIKPLSLSGSRGVIKLNSPEELNVACHKLESILKHERLEGDERTHVLIEQYIPGYEYAYEGLLCHGELSNLAIFDKPDLMDGPYFEETYYVTPSRLDNTIQLQIHQAIKQACDVYGLKQGPVHAEVRLYQGKVWLMEMASRTIGGDCGQLIEFVTGKSIERWVIEQALGQSVDIPEAKSAAGVMMMPAQNHGVLRRVEGLLEANKVEGIERIEVTIPAGYEIIPLPEGFSYLGFIFAKAENPDLVEKALRSAWGKLKVVTATILPLL